MSVASVARNGTCKKRRRDYDRCSRVRWRNCLQEIQGLLARQKQTTRSTAKETCVTTGTTTSCISRGETGCREVAKAAAHTEKNRDEVKERSQSGKHLTTGPELFL